MKKNDNQDRQQAASDPASKKKSADTSWESIKETGRTLFWAILIAMVVRTFLFEPFNIPSGSMIPTLRIGDYMFVSKYSYGYSRYSFPKSIIPFDGRIFGELPERGDVAVFRHPDNTDVDYVKRIIGLPGDTIQMRSGVLHINGEAVKRRRVEDYSYEPNGYVKSVKHYIETLPNGRKHPIIEVRGDESMADNTRVFKVREGHFFAMGDNRDNSNDSRFPGVGQVPVENLVGKAQVLFFSVDESVSIWKPWTWPFGIRYSRLLDGIE